jgi:hypothetical protein
MPTPKAGYYTASKERIPSVTTVLGRFKESGALLRWAYEQGRAGRELYEQRDTAADIGTLVHHLVEADLRGEPHPPVPPEWEERVISAYSAWLDWWRQSRLEVVATELQLVSERHRFGGTPDAIGRDVSGRLVLLDWKTSNGVYVDYLCQLAAYGALWDETHPDTPITGGYHLVRFAKESGDFAHHFYPELAGAWEQFLLLRRAYDLDKQLKKRAA